MDNETKTAIEDCNRPPTAPIHASRGGFAGWLERFAASDSAMMTPPTASHSPNCESGQLYGASSEQQHHITPSWSFSKARLSSILGGSNDADDDSCDGFSSRRFHRGSLDVDLAHGFLQQAQLPTSEEQAPQATVPFPAATVESLQEIKEVVSEAIELPEQQQPHQFDIEMEEERAAIAEEVRSKPGQLTMKLFNAGFAQNAFFRNNDKDETDSNPDDSEAKPEPMQTRRGVNLWSPQTL